MATSTQQLPSNYFASVLNVEYVYQVERSPKIILIFVVDVLENSYK